MIFGKLDRSHARIGWLAATLALGLVLVVGAWMNRRAAASAASLLNRGQAQVLEANARAAFHPWGPEVDSAALAAFVEEHAGSGLRYVALIDPTGALRDHAGVPLIPPAPPERGSSTGGLPLLDLGERLRVYFPRPAAPGEGRPDFRRQPQAEGGRPDSIRATNASGQRTDGRRGDQFRGGRGAGGPAFLLLEFEPVVASGVIAGATRSLVLAGVAATILTFAALLFWSLSEKYDRARLALVEQRRLTQLGEMSAVMAHEIRNPLASLKGHAQLLAEGLVAGSKERGRAERVINEATRLESLTSDLLDFARSAPLDLTTVDPVAPVHACLADLGDDSFELDAGAAPHRWQLDVPRVRQLLLNVLQNARQASPDGPKPRVRVAQEERTLVYEVRDFGPGLPAGSEARIFDPFFTTRTNGTGLGLAVARRVAEMHGGTISARNHEQGGALFRIEIPAAPI
jgi:two-component system sensor histidine kinase HydH